MEKRKVQRGSARSHRWAYLAGPGLSQMRTPASTTPTFCTASPIAWMKAARSFTDLPCPASPGPASTGASVARRPAVDPSKRDSISGTPSASTSGSPAALRSPPLDGRGDEPGPCSRFPITSAMVTLLRRPRHPTITMVRPPTFCGEEKRGGGWAGTSKGIQRPAALCKAPRLRVHEAPDRLPHEDARHGPNHHHGRQGPEHFGAQVAKAVRGGRAPLREALGEERDGEARDVRHHVHRVAPEGQGVAKVRRHHFGNHEGQRQDERRGQPPRALPAAAERLR